MPSTTPTRVLLALAASVALPACAPHDWARDGAIAPPGALAVNERDLPSFIRLQASDLDTTIDACESFADHVNGKWIQETHLPAHRSSWGVAEVLDERSNAIQMQLLDQLASHPRPDHVQKLLGDLWTSGLDEARINAQGLAPLAGELNAIDVLHNTESIVAYLHASAARGQSRVLAFWVSADYEDASTYLAFASQGNMGLPDSSMYSDPAHAALLQRYREHIAAMLRLSGIQAAPAAEQAEAVLALEARLAAAGFSREKLAADPAAEYNPVSLAQAEALAPNFKWREFFTALGLDPPEKFSLGAPAYHRTVSDALADTAPSTWRAFLRFHQLKAAAPYLPDAFGQEAFAFDQQTLRGTQERAPRRTRVMAAVNRFAGDAMGREYVAATFSPRAKQQIETMVSYLKAALKTRIEQLAWMGDETRAAALRKLEAATVKVGHPDRWRDWSGVHTDRSSYLGNIRALREFSYRYRISRMGKPVDRDEWMMHPQTANAYYMANNNELGFPAAYLQPPQFDPQADDALNYGGIGATIGHELIHGFDVGGSRFGPTGELENWWTADDAERFAALARDLEVQMGGYRVGGKPVNGKLTPAESMADLGGLAVAFDAMRLATAGKPDPKIDGQSREQRFFYNYAASYRSKATQQQSEMDLRTSRHPPYQIRAMAAPSNHPGFAAAFQCKAGTPMARSDRVQIW